MISRSRPIDPASLGRTNFTPFCYHDPICRPDNTERRHRATSTGLSDSRRGSPETKRRAPLRTGVEGGSFLLLHPWAQVPNLAFSCPRLGCVLSPSVWQSQGQERQHPAPVALGQGPKGRSPSRTASRPTATASPFTGCS